MDTETGEELAISGAANTEINIWNQEPLHQMYTETGEQLAVPGAVNAQVNIWSYATDTSDELGVAGAVHAEVSADLLMGACHRNARELISCLAVVQNLQGCIA